MAIIDPGSIVDVRAELADDVEVGPFCIIRGPVTIASGTRLLSHVCISGPVSIGRNNTIYPFTTLGLEPQDRKYNPRLPTGGVAIGDNNLLREGVTIHRATKSEPTRLGNDNFLMCHAHLGHDAVVGNRCTLANSVALGGHVHVEDQVTIGGATVIHQFVRLGRLCMLSGGIGLVQDVPPFCTAYNMRQVESLNLVGLRRAGCREHIANLQRAFRLLYKSGHTVPQAVERIAAELGDDPLCAEMVQFIRNSTRGITDCRPSGAISQVASVASPDGNGEGIRIW